MTIHPLKFPPSTFSLDLSRNKLWGVVPTQLGLLSRLTTLSLFGNTLTGSLPAALKALAPFQSCVADYAQVFGELELDLAPLPPRFPSCNSTLYAAAVLQSSPIGYWRLNEGSGTTTAVDCSYSSADAAYSNSTTPGGYR